MSTEIGFEYIGQVLASLRIGHPVKARISPGSFTALDDKSAGVFVELVGMRNEQARFVFAERKSQSVEQLMSPEPDKTVLSDIERGLKVFVEHAADKTVGAVGSDQQIVGLEVIQICNICFKSQIDAQLQASLVEDVQKREPADSRKSVASNSDLLALVDIIDIVPALARTGDGVKRFLVVVLEVRKSLVRKDDSPTERVIWCVVFEDGRLVRTIELFHQDCEIQP